MQLVHGVVRGQTIYLAAPTGLADGVEVSVYFRPAKQDEPWGAGLLRCAGALAGIDGLDEDLDAIVAERRFVLRLAD